MKKFILLVLAALVFVSVAEAKSQRGYYKPSSGKYVQPHFKSSLNKTKLDNYSTKGNSNPYTGKKGSVDPYKMPSYSKNSYKY